MAKTTPKKKAARKKDVNKSQAIRDYMAKNKSARTSEVVAGLAKKGVSVSPTLVSKVKAGAAKKPKGKRVKVVKKKSVRSTPLEDVKQAGELMYKAVELVLAAGTKEAQHLVSTASDIVKKIRE